MSFTITEERGNDPDDLSCRSLILCRFDSWVNQLMPATQQLAADTSLSLLCLIMGKTFNLIKGTRINITTLGKR